MTLTGNMWPGVAMETTRAPAEMFPEPSCRACGVRTFDPGPAPSYGQGFGVRVTFMVICYRLVIGFWVTVRFMARI